MEANHGLVELLTRGPAPALGAATHRNVYTMTVEPSMIASPHWEKALASLIVAIIALLIYGVARSITMPNGKETQRRDHWNKAVRYMGWLTAILLLGCIWVAAIRPVVIILGLLVAALAIVHRAAILSLTGGLFISWRGLFSVGDRIQIGEHRGDVIGTGPLYFTLFEVDDAASGHQSTGRILKIPNHMVVGSSIVNHSKFFPHVWNELTIVLKPTANWVKAKTIFQQLTEKHTKAYEGSARAAIRSATQRSHLILQKTSPKVYVTLQHKAPAGIKLTSRFLCETRAVRDTEVLIYEALLTRFNKEGDIELAFDMPSNLASANKSCREEG